MNEFDELYNRYFGKGKDENKIQNDRMNKIMNLISKLNSDDSNGINSDEENLGEPTTKRTFVNDGITFEELTWETEFGTIVKITTKEDIKFTKDFFNDNNIPFGRVLSDRGRRAPKEISLEESLEIAVKSENYEEAAKLRDQIEKKLKKEKPSQKTNTKGLTEDNEWNF